MKRERAAGRVEPVVAAEHRGGARHAADHQRVPAHEHLLVAAGPHARCARGEELLPRRIQQLRALLLAAAEPRGDDPERHGDGEVPVPALEIRLAVEAVVRRDDGVLLGRQQPRDLARRPDVELALLVLGVRVERRVVAAFRRLHLAHHPLRGLPGNAGEKRLPGRRPALGVEPQQRAVVVEHFLEVRDGPGRIHRVAAEAAAELVVDAALCHALEGEHRDVQRLLVAGRGVAPERELEIGRVRKLRRAAEPAVPGVEALLERPDRLRNRPRRRALRRARRRPGACARTRPRSTRSDARCRACARGSSGQRFWSSSGKAGMP